MNGTELDSLFLEAMELSAEERERLLSQQEPAVRGELEARLRAKADLDAKADTYLNAPVGLNAPEAEKDTHLFAAEESRQATTPTKDTAPSSIGRFPVLRELARGGQGFVYLATHPDTGQKVVIKVSRHQSDDVAREALEQEAEIVGSLDHPGLGKLIGIEFDEGGRPLVVLEYIPGLSLQQKLETENLGPERAALLVATLAEALQHAHERGLVHQDLKPANVVFAGDHPKVIDFGLARERSAWYVTPEAEAIGGSPQYISPEQAQNFIDYSNGQLPKAIDHRADIFGLGAVLYRILTGKPPFNATSRPQILSKAAAADFDKSLLDAPSIPGTIRDTCLKAMHADRCRRYDTAKELAVALRAAAGHVDDPERSLPKPLLVGGASLLLILACFVGWQQFWQSNNDLANQTASNAQVPDDKGGTSPKPEIEAPGDIELPFGWIRFTHIKIDYGNGGPQTGDLSEVGESTPCQLFSDGLPRETDQLRIDVAFDEPRYAFLFALNPDGVFQSCYPPLGQESIAQQEPFLKFTYPADSESGFQFSDGPGPQAFFLVASTQPLGSLDGWKDKIGNVSWPPAAGGGPWVWDKANLRPYSAPGKTRGAPKTMPGLSEFTGLAKRIESSDSSLGVYGLLFEVEARP